MRWVRTRPAARGPLTLPPAVPNLPEAAALTEPVQALLLDQLQDLRLDLLPQLPGCTCMGAKGGEGTAKQVVTPPPAQRTWQHLHDWRGLEVILTHPLGLAQSQDLRVAQATQFALELIQRAGFGGQSSSDLLSDHLHDLKGKEAGCLRPFPEGPGWFQAARLCPRPGGTPDTCWVSQSTDSRRSTCLGGS